MPEARMCELMGMCFGRPVSAEFSISAFALRDEENADGWGLGWYSDHSMTIVKEPLSWRKSRYAKFLTGYDDLVSHMYIAHVRHATVGGAPKHADTHPFSRELGGRIYGFAHNGTVRNAMESLMLDRFQPIGATDSEHVFCSLLGAIAARDHDVLTTPNDFRWLAEQFGSINRMGKFNCILADGDRLFAWHDVNAFKGLHFHAVKVGDGRVTHLEDETMEFVVENEEDLNCAACDSENRGIVVATRPLSDAGWHAFLPGELLVLHRGRVEFSSVRSNAKRDGPMRVVRRSPSTVDAQR
jgi:glutamine amidotransferase